MKLPCIHDSKCFAVIDTETNWNNEVMSIGVVIADSDSFEPVDKKYYIVTPECNVGGMYSRVMIVKKVKVNLRKSRTAVINHLINVLRSYKIESIFAYNASFDYKHLPELQNYMWFDIMKFAAYKQYNKQIPENAECCGTGRLKRNYGVEPIMQMLSRSHSYREIHNALCDAVDELKIMKFLGYTINEYACTQINPVKKRREKHSQPKNVIQRAASPVSAEQCQIPVNAEKTHEKTCKYAVGDRIRHKEYGYGIILKAEIMNSEILLLTVKYKTIGISLHFLPDDEKEIIIINNPSL